MPGRVGSRSTPSLAMLCWSFPGVAGKTGGVLKTLQLKSKGFRVYGLGPSLENYPHPDLQLLARLSFSFVGLKTS